MGNNQTLLVLQLGQEDRTRNKRKMSKKWWNTYKNSWRSEYGVIRRQNWIRGLFIHRNILFMFPMEKFEIELNMTEGTTKAISAANNRRVLTMENAKCDVTDGYPTPSLWASDLAWRRMW